MTSPLIRLSHISYQVANAQSVLRNLMTNYRFRPFAARGLDGGGQRQVALRNGGVVLLVNENGKETPGSSGLLYDSPLPLPFPDTACNVSFEVEDVPGLYRRLVGHGCEFLVPPTEVHDDFGSVTYCVVKSVVGNVSHTLIDRTSYGTGFLPGFRLLETGGDSVSPGDMTHVDHVAYACPRGATPRVIEWYRRCLGFQHFPLSRDEVPERGLEITGRKVGLRLTSMECPGLTEGSKLVLCESLPQEGSNQVEQFLQQHGGAGIQHVGLYTPDILRAASNLAQSGVNFASQPLSYYTDPQKREEICNAGLEPQLLSRFGILLDVSAEGMEPTELPRRCLIQVFTEPLFGKDSFYLELIERRGASGFGEGNIRALWRSMQEDLDQKEQQGTVIPTVA
ncbi:4-hydroxyphenylpyruvate dioxygenase-like protein [Ascaphus truei]|uniref:4-hydroxyphenylpyruvate dioxygenase-like protein n=1 Tax=Ascaphus truei TaxID=8439 RepID=UPI003F59247C